MKAREIKKNMRFTYPGAFYWYNAGSHAETDPRYTTKVIIHCCWRYGRSGVLDIRLDAEQEVEVED